MTATKKGKLIQYVNYKMKCTLQDGRIFVGTMMAFDRHMNLILGDCDEFRRIKTKSDKGVEREEKRVLGFVLLRGEHVVSLQVEAPPAPDNRGKSQLASIAPGIGMGRAVGRGFTSSDAVSQYSGIGSGRGIGVPTGPAMVPGNKAVDVLPTSGAMSGMPPPPSGMFVPGIPPGMMAPGSVRPGTLPPGSRPNNPSSK